MEITPDQGMEIDGNLQVPIIFSAVQWSSILTALDEMPHKIARPLSDAINSAIVKAARPKPEKEESKPEKKLEDNGKSTRGKSAAKAGSKPKGTAGKGS